jgi:cytochrome c oxidase subunit 1
MIPRFGIDGAHLVLTIAGFDRSFGLDLLYNFFNSIKNGEKAEGNVWNSRSPEWQVPSPMPA